MEWNKTPIRGAYIYSLYSCDLETKILRAPRAAKFILYISTAISIRIIHVYTPLRPRNLYNGPNYSTHYHVLYYSYKFVHSYNHTFTSNRFDVDTFIMPRYAAACNIDVQNIQT